MEYKMSEEIKKLMERANIGEHYDTFKEKQDTALEEQEELSLGDKGISTAQSGDDLPGFNFSKTAPLITKLRILDGLASEIATTEDEEIIRKMVAKKEKLMSMIEDEWRAAAEHVFKSRMAQKINQLKFPGV